jgi:Carboxypeptidase regulatory-like domain
MNLKFPSFRIARATAISLLAFIVFFGAVPLALAGTVSGTVTNGTTGKPAAGAEVILIQLQGGMQPVANTKTDAKGRYSFENPGLGAGAPMLIRVVYGGVNYHEPVPPGKITADVQVFEPTDKPSAFRVTSHAVIVQPNGSDLMIGEEYSLENKTQPPVAFYRADGSFDFSIPDGADFSQASAWGSAGMPVVQGTIDKGKNKLAIAFAFRPGESGVRISYKVPYPGNQIVLKNVSSYATDRLIIAAPPSVQISGDGITPAGQDQGFSVYTRTGVAADTPLAIKISGTAPMPSANQGASDNGAPPAGDNSANASVNSRLEASGAEATTVATTTVPARLDSLKWVLVGGFASIFALGFIYLFRRPQVMAPTNGDAPAVAPAATKMAYPPASHATTAATEAVAEVTRAVTGSLDELKDSLFRLELRRQAGTITQDDYDRERRQMEKVLRDLVRG